MWFTLRCLCLVTVVLCIEQPRLKNVGQVEQNFHFRRSIDGRRGRKYFNPNEDGSYDSYGSAGGYYDSSEVKSGFADIRSNVPGEPGVDYPVYERVPKTRFSCEGRVHGYYADEDAGCQAFHVCHNVVVSSFICPVGSIFSQQLLTCDWWNKVDCATSGDYYSLHQGIFKDSSEMVQKAYTMTELPEHSGVESHPQIGRGQYYSHNPTGQFGVDQNFGFEKSKAVANGNTLPKKNIINVNIRPQDFEINDRGQNLRLNNYEDSAVVYIQKNVDYNPQDSYSTLQPFRLGNNFQNSYQQNEKVFRNEFEPSYAPTVPTVTTTTRRLYSPTVPTMYRPSTISYDKDDQYSEGSDHLYTHGKGISFLTARSMIDYDDTRVEDERSENPTNLQPEMNQQLGNTDKTTANKERDGYDFAEIIQSKESIGIGQSYSKTVNKGGNNNERVTKSQTETNSPSGVQSRINFLNSESNVENTRTQLETKPMSFNSNVTGNQQTYQHFYADQLFLGRKRDQEANERVDSVLAENYTQAGSTVDNRVKSLNSINSRLGIPPLIVQIPRPSGSSEQPVADIADQLFSAESLMNMSSSTPEIVQPAVSTRIDATDVISMESFDLPATRIPPLIPQNAQPSASPGSQSPGVFDDEYDDDETFDSPPSIPLLIPQTPSSSGSSGLGSTVVDDRTQTFDSSTRIPPLIPQLSQSAASPGLQSPGVFDDDETFDSPPSIPPLIPQTPPSPGSSGLGSTVVDDRTQTFDSSTRIPPLIPQLPQSAASPGSQSPGVFDDDKTFDSPPRIPPLIPQTPSSPGSSGLESTDVDDQRETFDSSTRIPPLITELLQSAASSGSQSPGVFDDDKTFDSPPRIPPLIPQTPSLPGSSGLSSTVIDNQSQTSDSSTRIPPLIPQSAQSSTSSGSQSPGVFDDDKTFDSPPSIPPLIPQTPSSPGSSGLGSTVVDDQSQTFDSSSRIPPMIPQSAQSSTSSGSQSLGVFDDDKTFDSPPRIPPLIPQIPQSVGSSGLGSTDVDDQQQTFDLSTRIPPLNTQSAQSSTSAGSQSLGVFDDDKTFDSPPSIPPLIPQTPPSPGLSGLGSTDVDDQQQTFDLSTRIPPLNTQSAQSITSSGSQSSGVFDDDKTFDSPPSIPPLIPQIPQSAGSSGLGSTNVDDQQQTFDLSTRIPPLNTQSAQSPTSSGSQSSGVFDDDKTFDSPPRIPPLISKFPESIGSSGLGSADVDDQPQTADSSTRIPPLIPQSAQSPTSSGSQFSGVFDDDKTFDSPPRIPPLISKFPESIGSSGLGSTDVDNQQQTFDLSTRIPPLNTQSVQSPTSSGSQSLGVFDDDKTFDSPPSIPPLIPQSPPSPGLSGLGSTDVDDQPQTSDSSTRIPPLITQSSQFPGSSGSQSPCAFDDDKKFDSPPRIPPLIPQIPQFVGSSGLGSTDVDDQPQTADLSTRIPPLIPQSAQSPTSSGSQSSGVFDDDKTFDSPPSIPPLISQTPSSPGSSGLGSTDVDDQPQTSDSSTRIPPLIPQSSQSPVSSGSQSPGVFDDDKIFDPPPRIPPLISKFPESIGSSGIGSTDVDDQPQTSDSSTRIPPLIPQSSQSPVSSGSQSPGVFDDDKIFDPPPRIPPLISKFPESIGSSGIGSTDVDDQPQTSDSSTRIPPLIPQSSQSPVSSGSQSPGVFDDDKIFDSPPRIPPLISKFPESIGSSGLGSANVDDQPQTSDSSPKIPPLIVQIDRPSGVTAQPDTDIADQLFTFDSFAMMSSSTPQTTQPTISPTINTTDVINRMQSSDSPTRIPPLIPEFSKPTTSSGPQSPCTIDNNKMFDSPPRIPPLISDIPQSIGSRGQDSTASSTRVPPIIPQSAQSPTSSRPQSPGVIDDDKTFYSPPRISPLIPQTPSSPGSWGLGSTDVDDQPQTFDSSTRVPPLIPQSAQSSPSSVPQSPSSVDDNKKVNPPTIIIPLISQFPQSPGSWEPGSADNSQYLPSTGSSEAHNMQAADEKYKSYYLPRVPPFSSKIFQPLGWPGTYSSNTFDQKQPPYSNNAFDSFNSLPSTTQSSYFTFQGQYQRPLPFEFFQSPARLPEYQFVTTPTSNIPEYDFGVKYGSKLSTETSTIGPLGYPVESTTKEFRIHVPDFPTTEEPYSTQSSILSTPSNPYLSSVKPLKTSVGQLPNVGSNDATSNTASSYITQTPLQASEVVPQSPTVDYQQSLVTEPPSVAMTLLPPRNHSSFPIPTEQEVNEHTYTEVKGPPRALPIPEVNRGDYKFFNQDPAAISSISDSRVPNSQVLSPANWAAYNDDHRFTIKGARLYPTATPSPIFNTVSPTYLPQDTKSPSGAPGQGVLDLQNSNIGDDSFHLSYSENPSYKKYPGSIAPNDFDRLFPLGSNFIPTSSQSPLDNFSQFKEYFESSTPKIDLDTTKIKSGEKPNASNNELLQTVGTSSLLPNLPLGFSHIESSLNNNDSPYEISFTVNGNEDFNPSGDFINKLLAQHANNSALGLGGFEGYEIVKSENPEGPDNEADEKSTILSNIEPSEGPTVPRLFDPRGSFGSEPSNPSNGFSNQDSNSNTQILPTGETRPTKIELQKSENPSQPSLSSNNDAALQIGLNFKSTDPSSVTVEDKQSQDSEDLSKLTIEAKDINSSFESLFEFVPPKSAGPGLKKEQILEELTKNFGQPLYNSEPLRYFGSLGASQNVNYNAEQQFANLEQYKIGQKSIPNQETKLPSPELPKPSTTMTPAPVKTYVETEFIPSLGFSFDSDDGRKEYVEAVLKGLLTENQPADPWSDYDNFFRESRENSKPRNDTTKALAKTK